MDKHCWVAGVGERWEGEAEGVLYELVFSQHNRRCSNMVKMSRRAQSMVCGS